MLSVAVVAVFVLCYNKIFAVTFDENFAKAVGTKADLYNLLIAITIAVVIVLAMNLVAHCSYPPLLFSRRCLPCGSTKLPCGDDTVRPSFPSAAPHWAF